MRRLFNWTCLGEADAIGAEIVMEGEEESREEGVRPKLDPARESVQGEAIRDGLLHRMADPILVHLGAPRVPSCAPLAVAP
jgi:hypothetical protein